MPIIGAAALVVLTLNVARMVIVRIAERAAKRVTMAPNTARVLQSKATSQAPISDSDGGCGAFSAWAMLLAQASMSFQSRKSPSGRIARAAGNLRVVR